MDNIILNIYDDDGNVVKKCTATDFTIKFGAIRSLMQLLDIEEIDNTAVLLKTISKAWKEFMKILNDCFPEMTEDDWDNINMPDLMPVIFDIFRGVSASLMTIPKEKN